MNDHLSGKELFIRFTARAFRKLLSVYVFNYFSFGFEGRIWDLIVPVPDHCLSSYSSCKVTYRLSPFLYQIVSFNYLAQMDSIPHITIITTFHVMKIHNYWF